MARFADALLALNSLKTDGIVEDYAIVGAVALLFWTEPVPTYDLDVLVFLPGGGHSRGLDSLLAWAEERGYSAEDERIVVEGVPTLFIPSPGPLADEAIETAQTLDYEGVAVRVARPEYLAALYVHPSVASPKHRERAERLLAWPGLNRKRLNEILARHGLEI